MKRVLVRAVAATTLGAAAAGGLAVASFAATDSVQVCDLYVAPPDNNGANVWVSGSRRGCSGTVTLTLELKKSYWGVDGVVNTAKKSGVNFELTSLDDCAEAGRGTYYGRLDSSGSERTKEGQKQTEC